MFKKKNKPRQIKKKVGDSSDSESPSTSTTTTAMELKRLKKLKTSNTIGHSSTSTTAKDREIQEITYSGSGTASSINNTGAFRRLDIDGSEEVVKQVQEGRDKKEIGEGYQGLDSYEKYINKSAAIKAGPIRGSSYVRISTRFDYAPDVCKDYKETGYCGYGDSCKFLHAREDYKHGWQIDLEYEAELKKKEREALNPSSHLINEQGEPEQVPDEVDSDLPFACFICRQEFKDPVVTKCGHYFCETCALKEFTKSPKCFICSTNTNGVFNAAKDLMSRIKKRRAVIESKQVEIKKNHLQD